MLGLGLELHSPKSLLQAMSNRSLKSMSSRKHGIKRSVAMGGGKRKKKLAKWIKFRQAFFLGKTNLIIPSLP